MKKIKTKTVMMLGRECTRPLQAVIGTQQQNNDEPELAEVRT